jgi:hypothetical protein
MATGRLVITRAVSHADRMTSYARKVALSLDSRWCRGGVYVP